MNSRVVAVAFLSIIYFSRAQQCPRSLPLSKDLVGKSFRWMDDCYRPGVGNSVTVYAKMTVVKIGDLYRFFNCPETYLIRYRTPELTPMIIKYPPLTYDWSSQESGSWSTVQNDKWCNQNQKRARVEMFPVEETRANFTKALKRIMPYMREIRDFGCETDEDGFWTEVQGRAYENVDVQQVMTYLETIAFQYSLCI